MSDTQKVKVTNWPWGTWLIGWMFAIGYIPLEEGLSFWEIAWDLFFAYLIWPVLLGVELSGGGL